MTNTSGLKKRKRNRESQAATSLARSSIYRLLALLFNYPTEDNIKRLSEAMSFAQDGAELLGKEVAEGVALVSQCLAAAGREQMEDQRLRVFAHVMTSDCHPCETAYLAAHLYQQGAILADISGFYRAFGVEPQGERSDHIAVELEFLALTTFKESYALLNDMPQEAAICRSASRQFLEDHLGAWAPSLAANIARKAQDGVMAAAGKLLDSFVENEVKRLRVRPRPIKTPLPVIQPPQQDEDDGCGPAPFEGIPDLLLATGNAPAPPK